MEKTEHQPSARGDAAAPPQAARATSEAPPSSLGPRDRAGHSALAAYDALAGSARLADLVAITRKVVGAVAETRRLDPDAASKVAAAAEEARLSQADADTAFGNALGVLASGPEGDAERALASALWAHVVAESPRGRPDDVMKLATDLLWLATHTPFDATSLLDRALGEEAGDLWVTIADIVRAVVRRRPATLSRGEAIVACAALTASSSPVANRLCEDLASELRDPVVMRVLAAGNVGALGDVRLEGELVAPPRGLVATTLLGLTGLLFLAHAARAVARLALAYRRPAEISITSSGVRVKTRTEMLGRTLDEREHAIARAGLVRVVREVRYPRAGFYAGLLALAVGSYIGVRSLVDGVRAASFTLLLAGLVVTVLGIAADFVLGSLLPGMRGRCRVAFVPLKGRVICIGDVDARRADEAILRTLG
jgi:hypothetical protein